MILTVLLGLLVLSALVIFHEFGHFWAARALGVRVERFSIGFGPVIFARRIGGVEFAISAFPLGGYVKMGGDDPRRREELRPGDFFAASWWRRVLIALAGPGANFFLGILLSIVLLWTGVRIPDAPNRVGAVTPGSPADSLGLTPGDRIVAVNETESPSLQAVFREIEEASHQAQPIRLSVQGEEGLRVIEVDFARAARALASLSFPIPAEIGEVVIGTPAYKAGLKVGDRIAAVDGDPISDFGDFQKRVTASPGRSLVLTVLREGRSIEVPITPFEDTSGGEKVGKIGIAAKSPATYVFRRGFLDGIVDGTRSAVATVGLMASGIISLFTNVSNLSQISGPVAIIQASGDAAQAGIDRLLDRAVLFSIALMVFNLLPIPILDGGMVLLSLLEAVRRRPLGEKGLALYQGIGIAVMGTLLIFVLINDPLRIIQRQTALGRTGDLAP